MELTLEQALQQGITAHKEGKLQDAERLYRSILNVQRQHPDANHNLGVLAVGVGKHQDALPYFKIALEENPNQEQFWLSYLNALIYLGHTEQASQVLRQGKDKGLKGDKIEQIERQLNNQDTLITVPSKSNMVTPSKIEGKQLLDLYNTGKFHEALEYGNSLIQKFPDAAVLYRIMGTIYASLDDFPQAILKYEQCLQLNQDDIDCLNNLSVVQRKLGRREEALSNLTKAIALRSDYAPFHSNQGSLLEELYQYDNALVSYKRALLLQPNLETVYNNLGVTLQELDSYTESILIYKRALKINPELYQYHHN